MSELTKTKIIISDPTLRDGNHAVKHQLALSDIKAYAEAMDKTGVDIVEVGHGNGLGASSLQLGKSSCLDLEMLRAARNVLKNTKLGVHIIPGFGCIERDLKIAFNEGVNVVRVASHCTEADTTERHINFVREVGLEAFGVLMMTHMASKDILLTESQKMQRYGAQAIILMDSAGSYLMNDVREKISYLVSNLHIPVGFHAHNNLNLAVANSVVAVESGATIIDGTACGFGAGAGNTALEVVVAVLQKIGYKVDIDLYKLLDAIALAQNTFIDSIPTTSDLKLISGLYGVFSGFHSPVKKAASKFNVSAREIFKVLGKHKVIAGQEDLIIEIAQQLAIQKDNN